MTFRENSIYHIYNQGNNRRPIFIQERNYWFFLKKMRTHLLPYVDVLAYCLMPNHFHWLVYTKAEACHPSTTKVANQLKSFQQNLSKEIGVLQSSYTKAINKQEGWSGSLFRKSCKSKECWSEEIFTINCREAFKYAPNCFNYIHENPVDARLVKQATDWNYSSAQDYASMRDGTLCNQALAFELGLL